MAAECRIVNFVIIILTVSIFNIYIFVLALIVSRYIRISEGILLTLRAVCFYEQKTEVKLKSFRTTMT